MVRNLWVVVTVLVAACDGGAKPKAGMAVAEAAWRTPFACNADLDELRKALGADYLEQRTIRQYLDTVPPADRKPNVVTRSAGTRCETAKDRDACMRALAAEPICGTIKVASQVPDGSDGWKDGDMEDAEECTWRSDERRIGLPEDNYVYIATRGDEVSVFKSNADLRKRFGPIDTPIEVFRLFAEDSIRCDAAWLRETPTGYEVRATELVQRCKVQYADFVYEIDRAGRRKQLSRVDRPVGDGCMGHD